MPASQLKRLKAAAHEQRIAKQKGRPAQDTARTNGSKTPKRISKATAQERSHALRAQQLLPEIHARKKVGGILDRRIGENDPSLAPEEKAARRLAAAHQRASKKRDAFNLEDAEDDEEVGEMLLTHGGKPLGGAPGRSMQDMVDDFELSDAASDDEDSGSKREKKRKRLEEQVEEMMAQRELEPDRKRSKKEVMEEVIAKSKLHKYERQRQKEADEDERDEVNKALPDLLSLLKGRPTRPKTEQPAGSNGMHPDRMQMIDAKTKEQIDKEYDQNLRQMMQDKRAQPTERTKTDEEKASDEAQRLRELEQRRQRRMRGEPASSDEEEDEANEDDEAIDRDEDESDEGHNEAADFGFANGAPPKKASPVDVEDEDDFVIDDDLIASGSDLEADLSSFEDSDAEANEEDDDEEFLKDVRAETEKAEQSESGHKALAYTYACPQSLEELQAILNDVSDENIPLVIQRIRALYHHQLAAENKAKIANFAASLVWYTVDMASRKSLLGTIETVIRHIHSLSKGHNDTATAVATAFRSQLLRIHQRGTLIPSDLITFLAIGSVHPTSDHFHQVVTPATTLISRWLGITTPTTARDSTIGSCLVATVIKYQKLSKRYLPEALRFTSSALKQPSTLKNGALVIRHISNLSQAMDIWADQNAFIEMFAPDILSLIAPTSQLHKAHPKPCGTLHQKFNIMLNQAKIRRRPLELHHHRPLPIKTSIPKFEENFDPAGHYDPDKERSEQARLQKEFKREKKGALRELRRDAEFMAREKLREKKEKDRIYEEKQRRIIGEIQREEGHEKKEYEREKAKRKGRF